MKTINLISKPQGFLTRFQMWKAALLLRAYYNKPSMKEFTASDADDFWDY
jgi:hypothetical protein